MLRMNRVRREVCVNRGLFIRVNPSARVEIHLFASRVTPSSHVPDGGGLWDYVAALVALRYAPTTRRQRSCS
jgi:hypothetical protein